MRIEHSMLKTFAIRNFLPRKFLQYFQENFEILKHVFPARKASNHAEIKTDIDINFTATVRDICAHKTKIHITEEFLIIQSAAITLIAVTF